MSKYIDAEKVLKELCNCCAEQFLCEKLPKEKKCVEYSIIANEPTADVAPVRHAHWITEKIDYTEHRYKCHCSACLNGYECDSWRDPIDLEETEWCLWCGAKMDEEVE